jgi:hypothetical protein
MLTADGINEEKGSAEKEVISTYSELGAALGALPSAPPGTVRVYRGQIKDYPRLEPSGLRKPIRNQLIWQTYSHQLYQALFPKRSIFPMSSVVRRVFGVASEVTPDEMLAYSLWFNALAQHYGPGSDFLDVTHSADIALWFALNASQPVQVESVMGQAGPVNQATDQLAALEFLDFDPWDQPGSLYAFDVPEWSGKDSPEPGHLVDLANAPEIFSSSPRIRAQLGCLIYCRNADGTLFDLRNFLVKGTPLSVRRPMAGAAILDRTVSQLFPSPTVDKWYGKFLSVPMTYAPEPEPPTLRRSIPVTVCFDRKDMEYNQEVIYRDVAIRFPLLHEAFESTDWGNGEDTIMLDMKVFAQTAVPILLEAPLLFSKPPGESPMWHHGLLNSDLPDSAPVYDFGADVSCDEVSLTRVSFQFSLLEQVGWDRSVENNKSINVLRGVWIRREGEQFAAALLQHNVAAYPTVLGFYTFRYDPSSQRFMFNVTGSKKSGQHLPTRE